MREITSIELNLLVRELRDKIIGSRLRKFYDLGNDSFRFVFYKENNILIYLMLGKTINETNFSEEAGEATSFALSIRKRVLNSRLTDFRQLGMDRILLFGFTHPEEYSLIIEMFGEGNFIIVNKHGIIESCYRNTSHKGREVRSGKKYEIPANEGITFENIDKDYISKAVAEAGKSESKLISALSSVLNIGPIYLEDIILRAKLDPKGSASEGVGKLENALNEFFENIREPKPRVYLKEGEPYDYSILPLLKYEDMEFREYESISMLLEDLYFNERKKVEDKGARKRKELEASIAKQREALTELQKSGERYSLIGKKIFERMNEINILISYINSNRRATLDELNGVAQAYGIKIESIDLAKKEVKVKIDD